MKSFSRRTFLKNVICGVGLSIIGIKPSKVAAQPVSIKKTNISEPESLIKQFAKARELFYKKKYVESEVLYKEILISTPTDISIYDGYKKLLSVQHRTNEILSYYKKAIGTYPERVDFYDRIAKTYREIQTGDKQQERILLEEGSHTDLLTLSIEWYKKAIEINPQKKFLYLGLLDSLYVKDSLLKGITQKNIDPFPSLSIEEQNLLEPYIQEWIMRKNPSLRPKVMATNTTDENIDNELQKIQNKKRRPLHSVKEQESRAREIKKAKKKLNIRLYHNLRIKNDLAGIVELTNQILHENEDETHLLGETRKLLKKDNRWDLQSQLYKERSKNYKDFWSQYGLAYASIRNGENAEAKNILEKISKNINFPSGKKVSTVFMSLCDCALSEGNMKEGKISILKAMDALNGLGGVTIGLLFKYTECLIQEGNYSIAKALLRKKLEPFSYETVTDPMLKYIAPTMELSPELYYLHQKYHQKNPMHCNDKISILCAIAKIQKKENDQDGLQETCNEIEKLEASHPFVRNIKSKV